jgi:signal transduction histidine kinase
MRALSIRMSGAPTLKPAARAAIEAAARTAASHPSELRWLRERLLPIALLAVALPIALLTTWKSLDWLEAGGRVFPGFFAMENRIVPTVGLFHWTGMTHRMPFAARVIAVDGRAVSSNAEIYDYVERLPEGTFVNYTIDKDGTIESRRVPTMRFGRRDYLLTLGLFVLNGFVGLGAGFLVSLLKPRSPSARGFLLYGFFWGLFPLTGIALYDTDLTWLSPVHYVAQAVFPATFIHFGLVFPVEREIVRQRPRLLLAPYLVSAVLLIWIYRSYLAEPPSWLPLQVTYLYSAVSMPIFLALLAYSYWENRNPMVRPRLQMIIPGFVVAAAAAVYGFVNTGFDGDFPINLIAVTPIVFFASIAYAIAAHDAFDINRLLRRTALYFTLTLVIAAIYAAIVAGVSQFVPTGNVVGSLAFQIPIFVLFGLLFQPLRERLQEIIDLTFFRKQVDYRQAVSDTSRALTSVLDLGEIFDEVGDTVTRAFSLESFTAVVWVEGRARIWRHDGRSRRATEAPLEHDLELLRDCVLSSEGKSVALVDFETGEQTDPDLAAELRAYVPALVVPIPSREGPLGAFLLGAKRSGLPFSQDDLDLLRTLSAQSAIAVQNALSYRSMQELAASLEDRVLERTTELERSNFELARAYQELHSAQRQLLQSEKLASLGQLVAGVAHEINNPVSFIVGNLEPLRGRLAKLEAAAQRHQDADLSRNVDQVRRIFDTIGRGAERTAGIVQDLRTFSRGGDAARAPFDVHEGLEISLRLLQSKWQPRITIEREYGDLPLIEAVPGQISQVLMNLLANACDAIPADGIIRIATFREDGQVRISISDDGTGIPEEALGRIFDPFFSTKPQGQGTGLGLSITHGIVEDHHGRIEIESRVGHGTTFTVRLPIRAAAQPPAPSRVG